VRRQNFSAHTCTLKFFHAVPTFTYTSFHCASCIFSAPTCAHSFLCASIPREFRCRNWGFFLTFSPIYHRHSTTMKFIQFHPDNTSSTYATTNRCKLTFLERIHPKSIHELGILFINSLQLSWFHCNFKFDQFQVRIF
jgi:hypothetical protein